jgi:hypothetical protein
MTLNSTIPSALLIGLALAGCTQESPVMCTMEARSSFAVVVVDSVTGAGLAATTRALVQDGSFVDSLIGRDSVVSGGVFERTGTYRLTLSAPGYQDWTRDGVVVTKDQCHVQTVKLRALLVPR